MNKEDLEKKYERERLLYEFTRTVSIIKELYSGKRLHLGTGHTIAMGEDLSIGFVFRNMTTGEETVGGLATLDLKQLNQLLNENNIGMVIPDV